MIGYLIRRVIQAVIVVIGVCADHLHPLSPVPRRGGSEARIILGPRATPARIELFIHQNGLNKPIWTQFVILVGHVFTFNLGYSYKLNEPVSDHHPAEAAEDGPPARARRRCSPSSSPSRSASSRSCGATSRPTTRSRRCRSSSTRRRRSSSASCSSSSSPSTGTSSRRRRRRPRGRPDPRRLAGARAAGLHARRGLHRRLQPLHALLDDGGPHRGLRPHGAGQGPFHAAGQLRSRAAQRPHPDHHPARPHAAGDRRAAPSSPSPSSTTRAWGSPSTTPPSTTTSRSSSARRSSPRSRRSSGRCSPTSSTPSSTRGSAMCEPRPSGGTRRPAEDARVTADQDDVPDSSADAVSELQTVRGTPGLVPPSEVTEARRGGRASVASAGSSGGCSPRTSSPWSASAWSSSCCCSASSARTSTSPTRPTSS